MITLKTLPQATEQEVFDQVKNHLLKQKTRSVKDGNNCVYLNPEGLKCAAGCLIGEDEYNPKMEGKGWYTLNIMNLVPKDHKALISDLQEVHDMNLPRHWESLLLIISKKYNLNY